MAIEIYQLRYAVVTADAKSFARAAASLNVKQITLSRKVQQLEDRLGIKLFERTTRGAEVTENGKVFIEQARRIVTDIDNLRTTARNVSYVICPLLSGPISNLGMVTKEEWNGKEGHCQSKCTG